MNSAELESELKEKKIRPVYLLVGEEAHIARRALDQIVATLTAIDGREPVRSIVSVTEFHAAEVFDTLRNFTLLGGRPLVIIREAARLSKEHQESLADILAQSFAGATLILVAAKLDGRSRLMMEAKKHAAVVECKPLYANQLPSWIALEARARGKQISQEAARYLADMVGGDLGQLAGQLERLTLFVGTRPTIELGDVETVVTETAKRSIFELTDAIGTRQVDRALRILANLLDHGQQPVMVAAMIARHLRLLVKAQTLAQRAAPAADAARFLGVHPFFAKGYLDQSRNFTSHELTAGFRLLATCDRALKTSRLPRERIIERVVLGLCRRLPSPSTSSRAEQAARPNAMRAGAE